jgi:hypothetical protein
MRGITILGIFALLLAPVVLGKDAPTYEKGKLLSMQSVSCGYSQNSAKSVASEIIGTDSGHSKTQELLCQEYVVQTDRLVYHVRPKDTKHPALLPVGDMVDLRIQKDKMYLRADDKEHEYDVVSIEMRDDLNTAKANQ